MKAAALTSLLALGVVLAGCGRDDGTYDSSCAAPPRGFMTAKDGVGHLRMLLSVEVSPDGSLKWAGAKVDDRTLASYANQAGEWNPEPQVVLEIASLAPCKRVEEVRAIMLFSRICKVSRLCSEGRNPKTWPEVGEP